MLLIKPGLSNPAESCQWTMVPVIIASRSVWFTLTGGSCIVLEKLLTVHGVPDFPRWPLSIGPILVTPWFTVGVRGVDGTGHATQTALLLCPIRPWSLALQLRVHSFAFTHSVITHSHAEWRSQADCIQPSLSLSEPTMKGRRWKWSPRMWLSPDIIVHHADREDGLYVSHLGCQSVNRGCEVNNTPYLKEQDSQHREDPGEQQLGWMGMLLTTWQTVWEQFSFHTY